MSKFRALLVSSLLAAGLVGGAITAGSASEAAPVMRNGGGSSWCC